MELGISVDRALFVLVTLARQQAKGKLNEKADEYIAALVEPVVLALPEETQSGFLHAWARAAEGEDPFSLPSFLEQQLQAEFQCLT